ncbi:MAG TPA: iron-containing redox enzyme family protein [Actinomycetota bacterium]|jgi:pyrroloquinoline-quinone synthase|nr:iron-containing redox enzyme family protein [Actinomycetota bacterium]
MAKDLVQRLDDARAAHPILEHPFYVAWAEGTLTKDDLEHYAGQYWRQVEAFPGYLGSLSERLPAGSARDTVAENLADEIDDDHPGLWLRFAEAVGVSERDVRASQVEPETRSCVQAFRDAAENRSLPYALGMLYGYEAQTPAVAETKVKGLRDRYGIDGAALDYFVLHGELDVEHAAGLARAIEEVAGDEEARADAEAGARAGAAAVWTLLDGVARVRNIAC